MIERRTLLAAVERGLWTVSALATLGASWLWIEAHHYQIFGAPTPVAVTAAHDTAANTQVALAEGTPIGEVLIPRIGLSAVVAEGATQAVLRRSVGHVRGSDVFGGRGNTTLAGHRDTHFRPLADVEIGDLVVLRTAERSELYKVEWTKIVSPDDIGVIAGTDYPALTLITCYPFHFIGSAPKRFVVRARLQETGTGGDAASPAG